MNKHLHFRLRTAMLTTAVFLLCSASVLGQIPSGPDPVESMPIHLGSLGLSPTLSITDFGVDSNIFNSPGAPQRDFTATIVPRLLARMRTGRVLLTFDNATGFAYYRDATNERSVNYRSEGKAEIDLGRIQPYLSALSQDTRERLNAEMDIRAPRTQQNVGAGTRLILGSKTGLAFNARRSDQRFDDGVIFENVPINRTMNSRTETADAAVQFFITPLTTASLVTSFQRDRFDHSPERDSNTLRIVPTVEFDRAAMIRGTLAVGYRRFRPLRPELPDYSGLLVQSTLGYTLAARTSLDGVLRRDVQYSFEERQPYYLTTGGRLTVTHHIAGPVDLRALGGRERLAYRDSGLQPFDRIDTADVFGGGVGYRVREDLRIGVNWEYSRRLSDHADRRYQRRRFFASLTYGSES